MFIDAHAHLDSCENAEKVVKRAKLAGARAIVTSGYSLEGSRKALELSVRFRGYVFPVIGISPQDAMGLDEEELRRQVSWVGENLNRAKGVGEIGLDFHWAKSKEEIERQYSAFDAQLALARSKSLPVTVHSRAAEREVLDVLEQQGMKRAHLHFFSGTPELAVRAVKLGYAISIPPVASKGRERMLSAIPLSSLMLESDCPYVGKDPSACLESASIIARAKGISIEEVLKTTAENAARFFGL